MRLTFVIFSLDCGGAERVMSSMANYWIAKGWNVTLLTLSNEPSFYVLHPHVNHIQLNLAKESTNLVTGLVNNIRRVQVLRKAIGDSHPEVVISFIDKVNILTLLATQGLNIPVIVSERTNPALHRIGIIWERLRQWIYPKADRIVVQTPEALDYFTPEIQTLISIIPNFVKVPGQGRCIAGNHHNYRSIIAMGSFLGVKGFDLLLQSFAGVKDHHPDWNLTILGDGPLRRELESLRDSLGLASRVTLPGRVKNPHKWLQQADLFVMSSRYEGFPNALCEAMACGLPVIATDCPSGPRAIIRDGIDGILVPTENVSELTSSMDRLMSNNQERRCLAERAPEVLERFSLEKIMTMWENLLIQVLKGKLPQETLKL
ncbi:MAG: glycosyltransferase family 4 protein [Symploca sp. SIO2D2]|nr:glycosyltransferase family 4 protein [Symploca sp. SIO2D2]